MAHAAPASRGPGSRVDTSSKDGTAASTDVFGTRARTAVKWALPLVLGLVFGYWVAANRRGGGPVTGWNLLFGFVTAFVFMAVYVAVRAVAPRLKREAHALLWAGFAGAASGFLISQTGASVLRSTVLALVIAAGFFAVLFYRYHTREDAEGHRVG
jgi:FtsH-binding integral membrane protein